MSARVAVLFLIAAWSTNGCTDRSNRPADMPGPVLAERGQMTAERVCGYCHQVVPTRESAIEAAAPSFMEIANLPGRNRDYLRQFTGEQHMVDTIGNKPIPMPTTLLSPDEREEVIAYILSFQTDPEIGRKPPVKLEPFE